MSGDNHNQTQQSGKFTIRVDFSCAASWPVGFVRFVWVSS